MKVKLLLLLLFIKTNISFAQFENRYWVMGYSNFTNNQFGGFNLDFYYNAPDTFRVDRELNISQGTSNISSRDGRFLFATNGSKVGDASNQIMINGDSLVCLAFCSPNSDGSNVIQSNIIIPDPGDTSLYYIFYAPSELYISFPNGSSNYPTHMYYAIVDMKLNGGLGAIISKNNLLLNDTLQNGKITACKHANGRDWWLVFKEFTGNGFITYLVSPNGVQLISRQPIGIGKEQPSQVCFSPDGSRFVSYDFAYGLQIFSFDRCTGLFSNPIYIPYSDTNFYGFGVAFSASSRYIYTSTLDNIFQYDLLAINIANSKTLVGIWDGYYDSSLPTHFFTMGLARDGKIYIVTGNGTHYIHRINYPDLPGASCNFQQRYVTTPVFYWRAVPNHPNYQLGAEHFSQCDTLTNVSEVENKFFFKIYPNPVAGNKKIFIEYNHVGAEEGIFEMFDLHGRKIAIQTISPFTSLLEVELPKLSQGIYIIKLKFNNWQESDKFVIE